MKKLSRIILTVLSVFLAALLALSSLYVAALYTVRSHYTPDYIYNTMSSLDYASLKISDGSGGTDTLCNIANRTVADFGMTFTEDDFNIAIRTFSLDAVITSFLQDIRSWAFDDGAIPSISPKETADIILSGLDQSLLSIVSLAENPRELLEAALSNLDEVANLSEIFSSAEPVRELLSKGTLIFVLSVCATLFLLIITMNRLKLTSSMIYGGVAWTVAGSVLMFADKLLAPIKLELLASTMLPEETLDIIYTPLIEALNRTGTHLMLSGLTIAIVFAVFGTFAGMIRREKQRASEFADSQKIV